MRGTPRDSSYTTHGPNDVEFWRPITLQEILDAIPNLDKSAGPYGITATQSLKSPRAILCELLNCDV